MRSLTTARRTATVVAAGLLTVALAMTFAAAPSAAQDVAPEGPGADWRDVLRRSVAAGRTVAYEGQLVVVSFDGDAPTVGQLDVVQSRDGTFVTGPTQSWMLGRIDGEAYFGDERSGRLLHLGGVEHASMSPNRIEGNYDVRVRTGMTTLGREVTVVEFLEKGTDVVRERLHIDDRSGLVLRRETFDLAGRPVRLAALTRLSVHPVELPEPRGDWPQELRANQTPVTPEGLGILRDVGWLIPEQLGAGFEILDAVALGGQNAAQPPGSSVGLDADRDALHLLYGDGLYSLSIYEQHGRLQGAALRRQGAVRRVLAGHTAYRWPGSEPATYVWSGDDLTFTVVSDAPPDVIAAAVSALPHDPPPSLMRRLGRGFVRVGGWLWPFG